ncbi:MAG: hypothetical protein Greene041619_377 [Candidatus Peregrinibacteria bacterium Greene0416_19]|nr:MAG: hypothetical protein Greene041619_377 [Candidatus Peregrinibacteria bacterium Greene0416_19]
MNYVCFDGRMTYTITPPASIERMTDLSDIIRSPLRIDPDSIKDPGCKIVDTPSKPYGLYCGWGTAGKPVPDITFDVIVSDWRNWGGGSIDIQPNIAFGAGLDRNGVSQNFKAQDLGLKAQECFCDEFAGGQSSSARSSAASAGPLWCDANNGSFLASLNQDGRVTVFTSFASNLVSGDSNQKSDVFVFSRTDASVSRVSIGPGGRQSDGASSNTIQAASADGRFVVFQSDAANLIDGDRNGKQDVFIHDRQSGETRRVSVAADGGDANENSIQGVISADGRIVAFQSRASNLVPGIPAPPANKHHVFVRNLTTGATEFIAEGSSPTVSADGTWVAFAHARVVGEFGNSYRRARLYNRTTRTFIDFCDPSDCTSVPDAVKLCTVVGCTGGHMDYPVISADGKTLVFVFSGTPVQNTHTRCALEKPDSFSRRVYAFDLATRTFKLVSTLPSSVPTEEQCWYGDSSWTYQPTVSADGRFIAFDHLRFSSSALVENGIYVRDMTKAQGAVTRQGFDPSGQPPNVSVGSVTRPAIGGDGKFLGFDGVFSRRNGETISVYLRDLTAGKTEIVSAGRVCPSGGSAGSTSSRHVQCKEREGSSSSPVSSAPLPPPPPPASNCGNGVVEPGEECDDGNTVDGDNCSSRCLLECIPVGQSSSSASSSLARSSSSARQCRLDTCIYSVGECPETSMCLVDDSVPACFVCKGLNCPEYSGEMPSISGDGNLVAFAGIGIDLGGPDGGNAQIYLRDINARSIRRVSVAPDGKPADGLTRFARMTPAGNATLFFSMGKNLVTGDTNDAGDFFMRDLQKNQTQLISRAPNGSQFKGTGLYSFPSRDGRSVLFDARTPSPIFDASNVYLRDTVAGTTVMLSEQVCPLGFTGPAQDVVVKPDDTVIGEPGFWSRLTRSLVAFFTGPSPGAPLVAQVSPPSCQACGAGGARDTAALSQDGSIMIFNSGFGPQGQEWQGVYAYDRRTGKIDAVSPYRIQSPFSGEQAVSADGRYVVYEASDRMVGNAYRLDTFVYDRQTAVTKRVSVSTAGEEGNRNSFGVNLLGDRPAISANGEFVVFASHSTNLAPGAADVQTNGPYNLYVRDLRTNATEFIAVGESATISGDGRLVAYKAPMSGLPNGLQTGPIIIVDRQTRASVNVCDGIGDMGAGRCETSIWRPRLSADGRFLALLVSGRVQEPGACGDAAIEAGVQTRPHIFDIAQKRFLLAGYYEDAATGRRCAPHGGPNADTTRAWDVSISADGRYVVHWYERSSRAELVDLGFSVYDRQLRKAFEHHYSPSGERGVIYRSRTAHPTISGDGTFIAFDGGFVPGLVPSQAGWQVFLRDRRSEVQTGSPGGITIDVNGQLCMNTCSSSSSVTSPPASSSSSVVPPPPPPPPPPACNGCQSGKGGYLPSLNQDGRVLVFTSKVGTLSETPQVYMHDRNIPSVGLVTRGVKGGGETGQNAVSADGKYIVFRSLSDKLVPGDSNKSVDIFVYNRQGLIRRVSVSSGDPGAEANDNSYQEAISAGGRYVTFVSQATNLVPGAPAPGRGLFNVYVRDLQTNTTEFIAEGSQPSISGDGRLVAYLTHRVNPTDTPIDSVVIYDRLSRAKTDICDGRTECRGKVRDPVLSADGSSLAFTYQGKVLETGACGDANLEAISADRVHVFDLLQKKISLAGFLDAGYLPRACYADYTGGIGYTRIFGTSISADGRHVAYALFRTKHPEGTWMQNRIIIYDRQFKRAYLQSYSMDGKEPEVPYATVLHPSVSGDGKRIAFDGRFADPQGQGGDPENRAAHVYLRDRGINELQGDPGGGGSTRRQSGFDLCSVWLPDQCATSSASSSPAASSRSSAASSAQSSSISSRTSSSSARSSASSAPGTCRLESGYAYGLSEDGRYALFTGERGVMLLDRQTNSRRVLPIPSFYNQWDAALSGDGRIVVFFSRTALRGGGFDRPGIYSYDIEQQRLTREPINFPQDDLRPEVAAAVSVSRDGRFFAFHGPDGLSGDPPTQSSYVVYRFDRQTRTIKRESVFPSPGFEKYIYAFYPSINGDGRFIAFDGGEQSVQRGTRPIFRRDVQNKKTIVVSLGQCTETDICTFTGTIYCPPPIPGQPICDPALLPPVRVSCCDSRCNGGPCGAGCASSAASSAQSSSRSLPFCPTSSSSASSTSSAGSQSSASSQGSQSSSSAQSSQGSSSSFDICAGRRCADDVPDFPGFTYADECFFLYPETPLCRNVSGMPCHECYAGGSSSSSEGSEGSEGSESSGSESSASSESSSGSESSENSSSSSPGPGYCCVPDPDFGGASCVPEGETGCDRPQYGSLNACESLCHIDTSSAGSSSSRIIVGDLCGIERRRCDDIPFEGALSNRQVCALFFEQGCQDTSPTSPIPAVTSAPMRVPPLPPPPSPLSPQAAPHRPKDRRAARAPVPRAAPAARRAARAPDQTYARICVARIPFPVSPA